MENSENQLNTISSLISQIHDSACEFLERRLKEEGLDNIASSHGYILYLLTVEGKMQMNRIAEKIAKTKSTTTVLINKLEKLGLIERQADENDKRISYISLSDKGRDYTEKTKKISSELTEKFYENFSQEEKNTIFNLLRRIDSNFQDK
ncbi:MAG: MarR family transcriptional regulator [Treponemataceae bacterium]|nr:MarR family transcriptional regulator [Treponemataceae bacterium]